MKYISEKIVYTSKYAGKIDLVTGIDDFKVDIDFDEEKHIYIKDGKTIPSVTDTLNPPFLDVTPLSDYIENAMEEARKRGELIHKELEDYLKNGIKGKSKECKEFIDYFENNTSFFEQKAIFDFKTYKECDKQKREKCFKQISMYSEGIYYLTGEIINQAYLIWLPNNGPMKIIDLTKEFGNCLCFNKYNNKKISFDLGNHFYINHYDYISIGIPHVLVLYDCYEKCNWEDAKKAVREFAPDFNSRNISFSEAYIFNEYLNQIDKSYLNAYEYWISKHCTSIDHYYISSKDEYYVKPVIFLKSNYQLDGDGTEYSSYGVDYRYLEELKQEKEKAEFIKEMLKRKKIDARNRSIYKCDNLGNIINEYDSIRIASEETQLSYSSIMFSLSEKYRFAGGFVWVYKDEYEQKKEKLFNEKTKDLIPSTAAKKAIYMLDDDMNIIKEFESLREASDFIGVDKSCIRDAAKGRQIHAGGYKWKYKEDE